MEDATNGETASQRATAELHRVIAAVCVELEARKSRPSDAEAIKTNRRFAKGKAARVSLAAGIARAAARELTAAKARVLDEVAKVEAAGFTVQEDFSVTDSRTEIASRSTDAEHHEAIIKTAVRELIDLDEKVAARLSAASKDLEALRDN